MAYYPCANGARKGYEMTETVTTQRAIAEGLPERYVPYLDACLTCTRDLRESDHWYGCPDGDLNDDEHAADPDEPRADGHEATVVEHDRVYRRTVWERLGIALTLEQAGVLRDLARPFALLEEAQPEIDAWIERRNQADEVEAAERAAGWSKEP